MNLLNESQTKVEIESPYLKLTRTPLARATKVCGISASNFALGLCIVYISFDLFPGFYIVYLSYTQKTPAEINFENKHETFKNQRYAAIALILIFGIISLIASVVFILGIIRKNTIMVFKSCSVMQVNSVLGRFIAATLFYATRMKDLTLKMGILTVIDIALLCVMMLTLGKFVGECRNIKYSNYTPQIFGNVPAQVPTSVNTNYDPQFPHYAAGV